MYLTVLGNNGSFPCVGGACSSYLLESDDKKTRIVLDFGPGALARLQKYAKFSELDAVILSHLHFDHTSDLLPLSYALAFNGIQHLKLLCPKTPEDVYNLLKDKFDVSENLDCSIGEMKLSFIRVVHPVETYAVKVECDGKVFVYTGDTNECPPLAAFANGADMLLADAGLTEQDWLKTKPHWTPRKCAEFAAEASIKQLVLTHLSPLYNKNDLLRAAQSAFSNVCLAEPDLELHI